MQQANTPNCHRLCLPPPVCVACAGAEPCVGLTRPLRTSTRKVACFHARARVHALFTCPITLYALRRLRTQEAELERKLYATRVARYAHTRLLRNLPLACACP